MEKTHLTPPENGAGTSNPPAPPIPAPPVPLPGVGGRPPVPLVRFTPPAVPPAAPAAPAVPSSASTAPTAPAVPAAAPAAPEEHAPSASLSASEHAEHSSSSTGHTIPPMPLASSRLSGASRSRAARRSSSVTASKSSSLHSTRTPLPDGTHVGAYTITSKIGIGGFGIVYAAIHTQDGTPVAIKEHMPEGLASREPNGTYVIHSSPETEERFKASVGEFLEEVTVLMGISHPGIVPILTAFQENGTAYYVMPFKKGNTLSVPEQASLDYSRQAQEARHVKRLLLSMLSIMDYLRMHQIVHRDIKPDNILVTEEGNTVLLDFGSARQLQPGKVFTNVFTPDFSAPEQSHAETDAEMSAALGPWTDLYSLGVCFYYLITHLFPPRSDLRVLSAVDPYTPLAGRLDLENLYGSSFLRAIDRSLELKPADRWQSAAAWRIAIGEGMLPTPPRKVRHVRGATIVTAATLALFAGISFWALRERSIALRAYNNSMSFTEKMLNDFNSELSDIPGATRLQRILGDNLNTYLNNVERPPGSEDESFLRPLAASWRNYGFVCMQQGKLEEADDAFDHAVDLLRELRESYSGIVGYPYDLANVLLSKVEVARSRNRVEQVRTHLEEAIALLSELIDLAPGNPEFLCSMGQALAEQARLEQAEGNSEQQSIALEKMLNLYRKALSQFPDHVRAQEGLGYALQMNAQYAMDQKNFPAAAAMLNESRQVFAGLASRLPNRLSFKKGLSLSYSALGLLYCRLSDTTRVKDEKEAKQYDDLALEAFRRHNDLVNYLETQDENKAEYPYMLCRALATMVDILLRDGKPNLAEAYCNTIIRKTEQLLKTAPDNVDYAMLAAEAWRGLALAHSTSAYYADEAAEEYARYRAILEDLLQDAPSIATLRHRYIEALYESSAHALLYGQTQQANEWLTRAESQIRSLLRSDPDNSSYTATLNRILSLRSSTPAQPQSK